MQGPLAALDEATVRAGWLRALGSVRPHLGEPQPALDSASTSARALRTLLVQRNLYPLHIGGFLVLQALRLAANITRLYDHLKADRTHREPASANAQRTSIRP